MLGGGSNLVIGDKGFAGTVVRIATRGFDLDGTDLELAAGEIWTDAVARTVEAGLAGIECLAGIPGSAGATPIQNVGAYGQEVSSTITEVIAYDRRTGETRHAVAARSARSPTAQPLQARPGAVRRPAGTFRAGGRRRDCRRRCGTPRRPACSASARATGWPLARAREAVLRLRAGKGMVLDPADHDTWSAGSFFTNPVLDAAQHAAFLRRVRGRLGADARYPAGRTGAGA